MYDAQGDQGVKLSTAAVLEHHPVHRPAQVGVNGSVVPFDHESLKPRLALGDDSGIALRVCVCVCVCVCVHA
jgi:hypothetical protein